MQACVGTPRPPPISRLPALPEHHHKQTKGTKLHAWGAGRGTARHLLARDTVPECTAQQAATPGGVSAKCAVQASLPYGTLPRFNINSAICQKRRNHLRHLPSCLGQRTKHMLRVHLHSPS